MDTNPSPTRYNKKWALFFPFLLLMRRLIFVAAIIYTPGFLILQLVILFGSTIANAIYLLALYPLEEIRDSKLEVFNEVTGLFLLYHLMCFTDMVPEPEDRYNIGYSFIAIAFINVAVHLILIIKTNYRVIRQKLHKKNSNKKT